MPSRTSSSSTLLSAAREPDTASIRPRNRRLVSSSQEDAASSSSVSTPSRSPARGKSPIPQARIGSVTGRNDSRTEVVQSHSSPRGKGSLGLLDGSLASGWSAVQELASSLFATGGSGSGVGSGIRDGPGTRRPGRHPGSRNGKTGDTWGPSPPNEGRPRPDDIAAGSRAEREAALRALRTASILENHEGLGGLDGGRTLKKRSSDEGMRDTAQSQEEPEEYLAYIHHVQPADTYAGIVLKYRCREDAFRRANGLWSRDNIQVRKWLAIPVDACEVKGRPCDPPPGTGPSWSKTPEAKTDPFGRTIQETNSAINGHRGVDQDQSDGGRTDDDKPWSHVRWVSLDSHPTPVEIARVPRKALGYFPPRRKKSVHTTSTLSTPRASTDVPNPPASDSAVDNSPRSSSSRRPSVLSARGRGPSFSTNRTRPSSTIIPASDDDPRPAWMRRPGGVGSLGRHVRAPGPEHDSLNAWARKHLPGLNLDSLPSMSIMGSETARFGFTPLLGDEDVDPQTAAAIAESPFAADGHDITAATRQSNGLDKAAAAIETWLRGAIERAKQQGPLIMTPILRPQTGQGMAGLRIIPGLEGDLIELEDTPSEDGRHEPLIWESGGGSVRADAGSGAVGGSTMVSGRSTEQWVRDRGGGPSDKKVD
ncbi:hypothetical protein VTJ49DRAFT_3904 [Mycothermus thermophilus]|uniref:LysM domain-containing protein n=1 Tax=Humicola insolens TaxID=85995 RepID=A0ABR3VMG7_HUMIN